MKKRMETTIMGLGFRVLGWDYIGDNGEENANYYYMGCIGNICG